MRKTLCIVILLSMLGVACITVRQPDGTSETRVDIDTTIALTQLALTTAEQALAMWLQYQAQQGALDEASVAQEAAARQRNIDAIKGILESLYAKRAAAR
jgi:hypothetical protein